MKTTSSFRRSLTTRTKERHRKLYSKFSLNHVHNKWISTSDSTGTGTGTVPGQNNIATVRPWNIFLFWSPTIGVARGVQWVHLHPQGGEKNGLIYRKYV